MAPYMYYVERTERKVMQYDVATGFILEVKDRSGCPKKGKTHSARKHACDTGAWPEGDCNYDVDDQFAEKRFVDNLDLICIDYRFSDMDMSPPAYLIANFYQIKNTIVAVRFVAVDQAKNFFRESKVFNWDECTYSARTTQLDVLESKNFLFCLYSDSQSTDTTFSSHMFTDRKLKKVWTEMNNFNLLRVYKELPPSIVLASHLRKRKIGKDVLDACQSLYEAVEGEDSSTTSQNCDVPQIETSIRTNSKGNIHYSLRNLMTADVLRHKPLHTRLVIFQLRYPLIHEIGQVSYLREWLNSWNRDDGRLTSYINEHVMLWLWNRLTALDKRPKTQKRKKRRKGEAGKLYLFSKRHCIFAFERNIRTTDKCIADAVRRTEVKFLSSILYDDLTECTGAVMLELLEDVPILYSVAPSTTKDNTQPVYNVLFSGVEHDLRFRKDYHLPPFVLKAMKVLQSERTSTKVLVAMHCDKNIKSKELKQKHMQTLEVVMMKLYPMGVSPCQNLTSVQYERGSDVVISEEVKTENEKERDTHQPSVCSHPPTTFDEIEDEITGRILFPVVVKEKREDDMMDNEQTANKERDMMHIEDMFRMELDTDRRSVNRTKKNKKVPLLDRLIRTDIAHVHGLLDNVQEVNKACVRRLYNYVFGKN